MARSWVIDASPLIALSRISRLYLLPRLCSHLVIPEGVSQEIGQGPEDDPCRVWLQGEGRSWVQDTGLVHPEIAPRRLGPGESHVLSYALSHAGYEAILDDLAARRCAESLGIPVRGTLGIILLATREGHLARARPVLEELIQANFRVDPDLLNYALGLLNE